MVKQRRRRPSKLRERFIEPPSQSMPPETFRTLFLDENEWHAIRELRRIRKSMRDNPFLVNFLRLSPSKPRGRPKGRRSIRVDEITAIAMAIDYGTLTKAEVLRTLQRRGDSASYRWLDRRLREARAVQFSPPDDLAWLLSLKPSIRKKLSRELLKEVFQPSPVHP